MESNRKKFKRTKSLTLNKKGHRYYVKSQNISQTLSSPPELTEPTSHEIPSDNFASQPAAIVSESASSNRKKFLLQLRLNTIKHPILQTFPEGNLLNLCPQKQLPTVTKTFKLTLRICFLFGVHCVIQTFCSSSSKSFILQINLKISINLLHICAMDAFHMKTWHGKVHFKSAGTSPAAPPL